MLNRLPIVLTLVASLLLSANQARAITDGTLDGNGHPFVGLMVAKDATGKPLWRCSGTLLAPTLFLTAGHCAEAPAYYGEIWWAADVETNHDQYLADGTTPNPNWNGYPFHGEASGTVETHPNYDPNRFFFRDLGVVHITANRSALPTTYGTLPALNYFDSFDSKRGQQDRSFTAVGYGRQQSFPDAAKWKDQAQRVRMVAYPRLVQVNNGYVGDFSLLLSNNANTGGTCFGDSGGPNFIGTSNVIGGVTSFGKNGNCAGTGGVFRLDRSWSLDWIKSLLPAPGTGGTGGGT